jgi:PAS domain S-box-containing protein
LWSEQILSHNSDEVIGRSFRELIWPGDLGATTSAVAAASAGRDLNGFQNRYRAKDGTLRWIAWRTILENKQIFGYGRGIAAQRERETKLLQTQEAL